MRVVIAYESSSRRYERAKALKWADTDPDDTAFAFPLDARKGDRVLYFLGGRLRSFIGTGRIESNRQKARSGPWKGLDFWHTSGIRMLPEPITGSEVEGVTGLSVPKQEAVLEGRIADAVWRAVNGLLPRQVEKAMEGAVTEARSRHRHPGLRKTALQKANGRCSVCRTDFSRVADGLGLHCLVVHHTRQISAYEEREETSIEDLAVVCANCHMMIHADQKRALSVEQLRERLAITDRAPAASGTSPSDCPACGGRVLPLVMGMPSPEQWEAAERGELLVGGCVVEDALPSGTRLVGCRECEWSGTVDRKGRLMGADQLSRPNSPNRSAEFS